MLWYTLGATGVDGSSLPAAAIDEKGGSMTDLQQRKGRIDLARVLATTDDDIARQIAEDQDTAPDGSGALEEIARRLEAGEPLPPGVRLVKPRKSLKKEPA
jgi:hypothetical protein